MTIKRGDTVRYVNWGFPMTVVSDPEPFNGRMAVSCIWDAKLGGGPYDNGEAIFETSALREVRAVEATT